MFTLMAMLVTWNLLLIVMSSISEQLEKSLESKLDVLFVTNHNTLDGFNQITDYKNDHEKFSNLKIYPAVEITTDKEAHVLVYGLHEEIKSNQTIG